MPEVAEGLELPDEDGVFVLDTYQGTPELVELLPNDLSMNAKTRHGMAMLNPLATQKASLELEGAHAKVHLHVNDPAIYLSLGVEDRNGAGPVARHHREHQRRQSGERQAWRAFGAVGLCDCARGRAPGGAHCGRRAREPQRHGDAGRGHDSHQSGSDAGQALAAPRARSRS